MKWIRTRFLATLMLLSCTSHWVHADQCVHATMDKRLATLLGLPYPISSLLAGGSAPDSVLIPLRSVSGRAYRILTSNPDSTFLSSLLPQTDTPGVELEIDCSPFHVTNSNIYPLIRLCYDSSLATHGKVLAYSSRPFRLKGQFSATQPSSGPIQWGENVDKLGAKRLRRQGWRVEPIRTMILEVSIRVPHVLQPDDETEESIARNAISRRLLMALIIHGMLHVDRDIRRYWGDPKLLNTDLSEDRLWELTAHLLATPPRSTRGTGLARP